MWMLVRVALVEGGEIVSACTDSEVKTIESMLRSPRNLVLRILA